MFFVILNKHISKRGNPIEYMGKIEKVYFV